MSVVVPIVAALIGVAGGIASTILADRLRRRRSMPDREQLREWLLFFDRPAWRGPLSWKTDLSKYEKALDDTIKAVNTGHLATRSGTPLEDHRVRGKSQLRDQQLRADMDDIGDRLERVRSLLREGRDDPAKQAALADQIDHERDQIVRTLNSAAQRFRLNGLRVPTSVKSYEEVYDE